MWPILNVADILSHSAAAHPDRTAIKLGDHEPSNVWFVDALPKGPTGKILKRGIRLP